MELIRSIQRTSLIILLPLAAASLLIETRRLPLGILAGGVLGLLNIRAMAWGIQGLLGTQKTGGLMIFFSQMRMLLLFILLAALAYLKLVNIFGLIAGFTVVFCTVIVTGLRHAKTAGNNNG